MQLSMICLLFTGAFTPLIIREVSIAYGKKDFQTMKIFLSKHVLMLYSLACFISSFLFGNTNAWQ